MARSMRLLEIRVWSSEKNTHLETRESTTLEQELKPRVWRSSSGRALHIGAWKTTSSMATWKRFTPKRCKTRERILGCLNTFQIFSWQQVLKGCHGYKEAGETAVGGGGGGINLVWIFHTFILSKQVEKRGLQPRIHSPFTSPWKPQAKNSEELLHTAYS